MNNSNPKQPRVLLGYDGELSAPIEQSPSRLTSRIAFKVVNIIVILLLAALLGIFIYLHPNWIGIFIAGSITAWMIRLAFVERVRTWTYHHLLGSIDRESTRKEKRRGRTSDSKRASLGIEPSIKEAPSILTDDLFLLYPKHRGFINKRSAYLYKYAFDGEERGALFIVVPIFGCVALVSFVSLWTLAQSVVSTYIPTPSEIPLGATPYGVSSLIVIAIVVLAVLFYGIIGVFRAVETEIKFHYLRQNGLLLQGVIINAFVDDKNYIGLKYRFSTPEGQEIHTTQRIPARLVKILPHKGTHVAILYANANSYKLL